MDKTTWEQCDDPELMLKLLDQIGGGSVLWRFCREQLGYIVEFLDDDAVAAVESLDDASNRSVPALEAASRASRFAAMALATDGATQTACALAAVEAAVCGPLRLAAQLSV
jgi:hypothetical protein